MKRILPWLVLLTATAGESAPERSPVEAAPRGSLPLGFVEVTQRAGIDFVHIRGGPVPVVIYEVMPPGAALFDYDGDGDLDLYLIQSAYRRSPAPEGAPPPTNRLYRNQGPDPDGVPRFVDVTAEAGVGDTGYGMGVAVGDADNDGDPDLYVTNYGPNVLYLNRGDGTFVDVTHVARVGDERLSASASFADVDGDGLLDLYVANDVDFKAGPGLCDYRGIPTNRDPGCYPGLPNSLYLNQGPGPDGVPRFREAAEERGVLDSRGRGLGVVFADLDDDGDIDLYIANDGGGNALLVNDGKGYFQDRTLISGTGYSETGVGEAGMGTDAGDFNGDGKLDLFVTNFARETNALYRNDGGGVFSYATVLSRLHQPSFVPLGWGTAFFDTDLDGDLDLFVANGHLYEEAPLLNPMDAFPQPNQLFLNNGDGTFSDVSERSGTGLAIAAVSRGVAVGDVDEDGDLDLYVATNGGSGNLLLNRTGRGGRRALRLSLVGGPSNRDAVGARVTVRAGALRLVRQVAGGGSYLSHSDRRLLIGLGTAPRADRVEVRWPSGAVQSYADLPADVPILLREGQPARPIQGSP